MGDDTLRERLADTFGYWFSAVIEDQSVATDAACQKQAASEAIELVREALLSDAAVEAVTIRLWGMPADAHDMAAKAIEAALDAAGLGGER